jgi:hypothetical protein
MSEHVLHYHYGGIVKVGDLIHPGWIKPCWFDSEIHDYYKPRIFFVDDSKHGANSISRIEYNEKYKMFDIYSDDLGFEKYVASVDDKALLYVNHKEVYYQYIINCGGWDNIFPNDSGYIRHRKMGELAVRISHCPRVGLFPDSWK